MVKVVTMAEVAHLGYGHMCGEEGPLSRCTLQHGNGGSILQALEQIHNLDLQALS